MYEICIYHLNVMFSKKPVGYNHGGNNNWKRFIKQLTDTNY